MGKRFSDLLDEEVPYPVTGITQDLKLRRQEPRRPGLGAGAFACSASEALLRQLRGLDLGLPAEDRAFLRTLSDQVRQRRLPEVDLDSPPVVAQWARIDEARPPGWLALDDTARGLISAWPHHLPAAVRVAEAEAEHMLTAAVAALRLSEVRGLPASPAFVGSLLHDLGRPFLRHLADGPRPPRSTTVEQLADGLHPALGAVLLEHWQAPSEVQLAVEHHHQPTPAIPIAVRALAQTVRAADACAHCLRNPGAQGHLEALRAELRPLELDDGDVREAVAEALEAWREALAPAPSVE